MASSRPHGVLRSETPHLPEVSKCELDEDAFERSAAKAQVTQIRACIFGIHQCFQRIFKTESDSQEQMSPNHLQVLCKSIQIVLVRTPELSLQRKRLHNYFQNLADKVTKVEGFSTRLQRTFKDMRVSIEQYQLGG
ncbi:hypothetical protein Gpo141_00009868 [Globisporangium polare]